MALANGTSTQEPAPILQSLRGLVQAGERSLSKPLLRPLEVGWWTATVRSALSKIYGKAGPQLSQFPEVRAGLSADQVREELGKRVAHLGRLVAALDNLPSVTEKGLYGRRVFIGHGRSLLWMVLKDFIADRLGLPWDEFNREAPAGHATTERLQAMMSQAAFAFLIMTAEEEHADTTMHARPNVIHEVGLFQGHLGFSRTIVMLEEGCSEFSNIVGLSQIRFPRGDITARFEEIRRVLERERLL